MKGLNIRSDKLSYRHKVVVTPKLPPFSEFVFMHTENSVYMRIDFSVSVPVETAVKEHVNV